MSRIRSPKEKLVNDIMRMGLMDVFVEEGDEATVVLNYQSLDDDVLDYNEKIRSNSFIGFGTFFLAILALFNLRISSSVFPENIEPVITSIQPYELLLSTTFSENMKNF